MQVLFKDSHSLQVALSTALPSVMGRFLFSYPAAFTDLYENIPIQLLTRFLQPSKTSSAAQDGQITSSAHICERRSQSGKEGTCDVPAEIINQKSNCIKKLLIRYQRQRSQTQTRLPASPRPHFHNNNQRELERRASSDLRFSSNMSSGFEIEAVMAISGRAERVGVRLATWETPPYVDWIKAIDNQR